MIRTSLPSGSADAAVVPGTPSPALALWLAVTCAHASLVERLDPETGACAVLGSDAVAVLLPLADAPDHQLRMHELAELSHLTRSGLTRRVDRLVADGLVARVTCPTDRRGAYAQVTSAGLVELGNALPHHVSTLERHIASRLTPTEVETLTGLLRRLYAPTRSPAGAEAVTGGAASRRVTEQADQGSLDFRSLRPRTESAAEDPEWGSLTVLSPCRWPVQS